MEITVKVPEPRVESLSSRARARGQKPRRGWVRLVTRVDRAKLGGYALVGDEPFLRAGERMLPVGGVVVQADYDGTARVTVVAYDGSLLAVDAMEDGEVKWWSLSSELMTLCDVVERAMTLSQRALCASAVARWTKLVAGSGPNEVAEYQVRLDEARTRLAGLPADAAEPAQAAAPVLSAYSTDELLAELTRRGARIGA